MLESDFGRSRRLLPNWIERVREHNVYTGAGHNRLWPRGLLALLDANKDGQIL